MSDSGNYFFKAKLLRKFTLFGLKFLLDIRYILWIVFIIKPYIGYCIKIMAKKKANVDRNEPPCSKLQGIQYQTAPPLMGLSASGGRG